MKTAGVPANVTSLSPAGPLQPSQPTNAAPMVQFDLSNLQSSYANVCNVSSTREEVVLAFGVSWWRRPLSPRRFVAKSQSRVARPTRGGAQNRGVLEKYVEGLSDEPVGLDTLGSGQACRSSGSAISAEPSRAFEAGDLRKHYRGERKSQPQN